MFKTITEVDEEIYCISISFPKRWQKQDFYYLSMKCHPRVHVLKIWCPSGSAVVGDAENLRGWSVSPHVCRALASPGPPPQLSRVSLSPHQGYATSPQLGNCACFERHSRILSCLPVWSLGLYNDHQIMDAISLHSVTHPEFTKPSHRLDYMLFVFFFLFS